MLHPLICKFSFFDNYNWSRNFFGSFAQNCAHQKKNVKFFFDNICFFWIQKVPEKLQVHTFRAISLKVIIFVPGLIEPSRLLHWCWLRSEWLYRRPAWRWWWRRGKWTWPRCSRTLSGPACITVFPNGGSHSHISQIWRAVQKTWWAGGKY